MHFIHDREQAASSLKIAKKQIINNETTSTYRISYIIVMSTVDGRSWHSIVCLSDIICSHQIYNAICFLGDPRLLNMLAAEFIIIFGLCIIQSNSCVIFELHQGKCEGPMYYQQYGPTETGLRLFNCAQWCMGTEMCKRVVWEQGVCAQVGLAGTGELVIGNVFTPKRPILLPGEFE